MVREYGAIWLVGQAACRLTGSGADSVDPMERRCRNHKGFRPTGPQDCHAGLDPASSRKGLKPNLMHESCSSGAAHAPSHYNKEESLNTQLLVNRSCWAPALRPGRRNRSFNLQSAIERGTTASREWLLADKHHHRHLRVQYRV